MKKIRLLTPISIIPLIATPIITTSCSSYSPNLSFTKVHEFINERSFSICDVTLEETSWWGVFGTMWLFYHQSDYTYYAITNNHVTSGFNEIEDEEYENEWNIYFGFQNLEQAKSKNTCINDTAISGNESTGAYNQYSKINKSDSKGIINNDKFEPLFTTYIQTRNIYKSRYYYDITIVKVDFSDYTSTETDIKTRLDKLNAYGNTHNNYLVEFDDYVDIDISTLYCGGFPLAYLYEPEGQDRWIHDQDTKFQSIIFDDVSPDVYSSMNNLIRVGESVVGGDTSFIYNADNTIDFQGGLFSPDWIGKSITDINTPFGGGASGSLAIRASDPDDVNTYRATGIYWGGMSSTFGSWCFDPYFSPFKLNFGKNIPEVNNPDIIDAFINSDDYPTNYLMYEQ